MERGKIVAIITGAISLLLAIAYLMLVQLLDFRGEMIPAPQSQSASRSTSAVSECGEDSSPSVEITKTALDINTLTC